MFADFLFGIDDSLQPRNEPRIDVAEGIDLLVIEAEPQRLGHLQDPVGRRRAESRPDHILVVALAEPLQHVVVEAGEPRLHRAQRLLQAFLEGAANRHHLADRFHGGGQRRRGAWEFLEGEARDLRHHIVDGGLEGGGRRALGDVVVEFVERVADGELGRDLGNREAGGLRGKGRGARHARVHLDDNEPAVRRIHRELHVRAARLHADLAQDRDGGVAHHLVFAVGKRQRRGDRYAVAGMHAHRIDVLDGADDDAVVLRVADNLHLVLFPAEDGFLDQDLRRGRGFEAPLGDVHVFFAIVGDTAARAAKREGRPDDGRKLDVVERVLRLGEVLGQLRARGRKPDLGHRLAEQQAILGLVDGMGLGADHLDVELFERAVAEELERGVERGLPAHGWQKRHAFARMSRALALDDLGDDFRRDRLDIGRVGQIRVCHDRRRIGIDQDDPVSLGLESLARLRAGIVEFAGLADHDRASPYDEDGVNICAFGHFWVARVSGVIKEAARVSTTA